ncbi:uncharacterized protein FOMMEDRAFT_35956, partial [Fomitiporia mediterranea MF3/22]|uniref:uncharacterized protein n=1 Tax=Fomitiporia mediterranea (strain MF3/22) TaxID=694068 RepID=UPI0004407364
DAQLLISPSGNATHFQKGYLGANDERAAIEGELQIKGVPLDIWESLTITLTSTESDGKQQIELNSVPVNLYSRNGQSGSNAYTVASSIPFAIPLTPDTPQCLHAGRSSLSHVLTATLLTSDPALPVLSRSINVHTKKFTSHLTDCEVQPRSVSLSSPTTVQVEVARTSYRVNEPIPVYVTIPPPDRSVILDHGFTLRSVRAELIRTIKVQNQDQADAPQDNGVADEIDGDDASDADDDSDSASSNGVPPSAEFSGAFGNSGSTSYAATSSNVPVSFGGTDFPNETIVARSGSSCRFHTSRPVKLRLVLHSSLPSGSPNGTSARLPEPEGSFVDRDSQCASISQSTVLHSVEFLIQVRTTFLHVSTRSERTFPLIIPVTILPPPAPLPELDPSLDSAYRKKHDRPPVKTVRREDSDVYTDEYETGQPGPSAIPGGAPPPFDDAPPPFFSVGEASTSRLPTFFESESEIIVPSEDHPAVGNALLPPHGELMSILGEGVLFGFPASERYDGHSDEMTRSATPPPSLEMAESDQDVTNLAELVDQPERAIDALNLVLEEQQEISRSRADGDLLPPPPPPPMDDPSDPPPSIDSEFQAPTALDVSSRRPSVPEEPSGISPSHAPPPYLNPVTPGDTEHVSGPPPYVD